jgi:hypothetical protein
MCPLCISTAALAMGGSLSGGGLLAFFAKKLHDRRRARAATKSRN